MSNSINSGYGSHLPLPYIDESGGADPGLTHPSPLERKVQDQANRVTPQDPVAARQQLVEAGRQFEAYFISYLLKVMRDTVPEGAITNKQGAYFHSFYDQEIGVRAAESGGIGIAKMVQDYAEKYFAGPAVQPSSSPNQVPIKDSIG
jgi:peptidoglycan hydrolase FlgJ